MTTKKKFTIQGGGAEDKPLASFVDIATAADEHAAGIIANALAYYYRGQWFRADVTKKWARYRAGPELWEEPTGTRSGPNERGNRRK